MKKKKTPQEIAENISQCVTWIREATARLEGSKIYHDSSGELSKLRIDRRKVVSNSKFGNHEFSEEENKTVRDLKNKTEMLKINMVEERQNVIETASHKFNVSIEKINQIMLGQYIYRPELEEYSY